MTIDLNLADYTYNLPDERIAKFPVEPRDASKLLVYQQGKISQNSFVNLTNFLPENAFLVFNNTKVIPARLFFRKPSGTVIEIFLLNPVEPSNVISQVMETTETCTWACMIGNKKRWKNSILDFGFWNSDLKYQVSAELVDAEKNLVQFTWKITDKNPTNSSKPSFAEIVKTFGEIPLPPYLKRKTEAKDAETYQTVYSKNDGAVAAPTAGLHFTERVFEDLAKKNMQHDFLTLHVGAGTFQPIKVQNILEHRMHSEQIVFDKSLIINILQNIDSVIAVGTTSVRSLESLYWFGVKLVLEKSEVRSQKLENTVFFIEKLFPYQSHKSQITNHESLKEVLDFMEENNLEQLVGETEIFIFPSYEFKICKGMITNFHQPDSTLILLVAAMVGDDWRKIYDFALENDFRFLSYGDSSLLLPERK